MDTNASPTESSGAMSIGENSNFEGKLRCLVGNTINVACKAKKLDAEAQRHSHGGICEEDLTYGNSGEKLLAEYLADLSQAERRTLLALVEYGREPTVPRTTALDIYERLGSPESKSGSIAVQLVEGLPTLGDDLNRGYQWARRRDRLRRLAVNLDETGTAYRALLEEEMLTMNNTNARSNSKQEVRGA